MKKTSRISRHALPPSSRQEQQRGVALFAVLIFVLLSALLALWASRTAMFNELVVSNDADYQRAFEAAQALLQDAELDISGLAPDGNLCSGSGSVCRTSTTDKIPLADDELTSLLVTLESQATGCRNALCAKRIGPQDFWSDAATLNSMKAVGARYGTYTGAKVGDSSNPADWILAETGNDKGGWYWIEILPYSESARNSTLIVQNTQQLGLNLQPSVAYRITALAYGRKPNTQVVLQETFVQKKL